MQSFIHNETELIVYDNGSFTIAQKGKHNLYDEKLFCRANFELSISGDKPLRLSETGFVFDGMEKVDGGLKLYYTNKTEKLYLTTELKFVEGTNVISQQNTVENIGVESILLTSFSSSFIENIGYSDNSLWYENDLMVYICSNKWQGEGQWQTYTPKQLGLYPATMHPWECESCKINSVGSWSTCNFYPLVIIEDKKENRAWFMEIEGSHSWFIKLCSHGGYAAPMLSLGASGCDESNGYWYYSLKPGEKYSTERTFFGIAQNGFEGAVAQLNEFKRKDSLVKYKDGTPPVIFNDYMNCVWIDQSPERLIPIIDRAAEAGCEIFCIDDGWQTNKNGYGHGDWIPRDIHALKGLADRIIEKGMIPGIWLELDACNENSNGYKLSEDCVLKRYDEIVGKTRAFYNFKSKEVTDYLFEKVKYLYDMGFRFIKNDYNQSTGIGCTNNRERYSSPAEGLIQNTNAFYAFIDRLYQSFPDLIVENCGSGAMRADNKVLRRGMLQSISDQELYFNNTSIMMGSMALMPPEKAGIWSYPYPVLHGTSEDLLKSEEYIGRMSDGYETSFNMVTSMFGAMYLSGRIDLCDEYNFSLIKNAVEIYKEIRGSISKSRPVYPTGLHSLNEKDGIAFGLLNDETLLLGVWNVNNKKTETLDIDLSRYSNQKITLRRIYPDINGFKYEFEKSVLKVDLPSENSAMFFEFEI